MDIHVHRDLGPSELNRLNQDLARIASWVSPSREIRVILDFPLTKTLMDFIADFAEQHELPATILVPPITPLGQAPFSTELARPGDHPWLRVAERGEY